MSSPTRYGLEQARIQLPHIVSEAQAGVSSVITRHGKPYAAVVPVQDLQKLRVAARRSQGVLALRGSGRGLWGADVGKAVASLRDEWGPA
ncbi:type II toxin-antitoxin system Phd/YefM family antitoxin [Hydrogenophaga sp.]|uniref:type II toxin-antitoxin system Phd/YefM family antitoxin n=1 Tax=Hydrogenophaga sp. TaxID=1904254 RepID=UPI003F730885